MLWLLILKNLKMKKQEVKPVTKKSQKEAFQQFVNASAWLFYFTRVANKK